MTLDSYGGHYGPAFATYFLQQNAAIRAGTLKGTILNLTNLGIGNGLTDPLSQYAQYMTYAASNPYHATASSSVISRANTSFYKSGGCQSQVRIKSIFLLVRHVTSSRVVVRFSPAIKRVLLRHALMLRSIAMTTYCPL